MRLASPWPVAGLPLLARRADVRRSARSAELWSPKRFSSVLGAYDRNIAEAGSDRGTTSRRGAPIKIILVSGQLKLGEFDLPTDSRFYGKPLDAKVMIAQMRRMISLA